MTSAHAGKFLPGVQITASPGKTLETVLEEVPE